MADPLPPWNQFVTVQLLSEQWISSLLVGSAIVLLIHILTLIYSIRDTLRHMKKTAAKPAEAPSIVENLTLRRNAIIEEAAARDVERRAQITEAREPSVYSAIKKPGPPPEQKDDKKKVSVKSSAPPPSDAADGMLSNNKQGGNISTALKLSDESSSSTNPEPAAQPKKEEDPAPPSSDMQVPSSGMQ